MIEPSTRAIIHLDHLRHNIKEVQKRIGKIRICMAVKADAYGHGAAEVARTALEQGVHSLGVANAEEAEQLRGAGIKAPLYLFGLSEKREIPDILRLNVIPFVSDREYMEIIEEHCRKTERICPVCLKADTGMGRIGFRPEDVSAAAEYISGSGFLRMDSLATHFPVSDTKNREFTEEQIRIMEKLRADLEKKNINPGMLHAANSGAIVGYPASWFDMVRPGIILYGYYSSDEQERILKVKPVMEFLSKVVHIKRVRKGTGLSYGLTYTVRKDSTIATISAGYADGYNRLLSNRGRVSINGLACPVAGRICMDQFLVDLGDRKDVKKYDDAVLFGPEPPAPDAEEIAGMIGSIPYEVTCAVSKRVPRYFR